MAPDRYSNGCDKARSVKVWLPEAMAIAGKSLPYIIWAIGQSDSPCRLPKACSSAGPNRPFAEHFQTLGLQGCIENHHS